MKRRLAGSDAFLVIESGMKLSPALFTMAVCLLALPFLTPCTLGLGTFGSRVVDKTSTAILGEDEAIKLPEQRLEAWLRLPGPSYRVEEKEMIRTGLVSDQQIQDAKVAVPDNRLKRGAKSLFRGVSQTLQMTDFMTVELLDGGPDHGLTASNMSGRGQRPQLVLSENPWLILSGYDLRYVTDPKTGRVLRARAASAARISIITPEGSSFALASRIHYDSRHAGVLLEGQPSFHSGDQWVKSSQPAALMQVHPGTKTLRLSVQADAQ